MKKVLLILSIFSIGLSISSEPTIGLMQKTQKDIDDLKQAMKDIVHISIALADYCVDNNKAPEHSGFLEIGDSFYKALVPFYIKNPPTADPWGNKYLVYCGAACDGVYGISNSLIDDFLVASYGKDGEKENWAYNDLNPESGFISLSQFNSCCDIVMHNGNWIRIPRELRESYFDDKKSP